jgi:membrane protease YdiL (CAAX protease family)
MAIPGGFDRIERQSMSKPKSQGEKIFLWFVFSIVLALLPIAVNYINGRLNGKPPEWSRLLVGGELFLIAGAVAGDAVGKVFLGGEKKRGFRIFCGAGCAVLLLITSIYFGRIAFSVEEQKNAIAKAVEARNIEFALERLHDPGIDNTTSVRDSLWLFGFTVAAALGVILVEED